MVAIIDWAKQSCIEWFMHHQRCKGCGQPLDRCGHWCRSCLDLLTPQPQLRCQRCALPIASGKFCGHCLTHPPTFDHTWTLDDYGWPLDQMIQQFKHQQQRQLAPALVELFIAQHPSQLPQGTLCSVPMHWYKRWRRGFNQSELLAQQLAHHLHLPYRELFQKPHASHDLIGLSRAERQRLVRHQYQLRRKVIATLPKHVILVDDVMTTGSTLSELAKQLKAQGVQTVDCWIIARTPKP